MAHASDHSLLLDFELDRLPPHLTYDILVLLCVLQEQTAQSEAREQAELLRRTRAEGYATPLYLTIGFVSLCAS